MPPELLPPPTPDRAVQIPGGSNRPPPAMPAMPAALVMAMAFPAEPTTPKPTMGVLLLLTAAAAAAAASLRAGELNGTGEGAWKGDGDGGRTGGDEAEEAEAAIASETP